MSDVKIYGKGLPLPASLEGICDFAVDVPAGRRVRILQLTDMQMIDASQRRTADRLVPAEIVCWQPELMDAECFDHIRSVVAQTLPDLILVTGDIVYGSFDDSGRSFRLFCELMDGFGVPWAPVFGNHDNESAMGVDWQCARFAESPFCLFARGPVHGNGNYTICVTQGGIPVRMIYMMDSNCCGGSSDPAVYRRIGFGEDQVEWLEARGRAADVLGVPGFVCFHVPTTEFSQAASEKGYEGEGLSPTYTIGVDRPALDGDMGCKVEAHHFAHRVPGDFLSVLSACRADGVFAGHCHALNTSVLWRGIRWTYGLKTGQYDYHIPGQLGGTLVELNPSAAPSALPDQTDTAPFVVRHVPSLVRYGPFPKGV